MNKLGETKFTKVLAKANTIRYNNIIISIDLFQKTIQRRNLKCYLLQNL